MRGRRRVDVRLARSSPKATPQRALSVMVSSASGDRRGHREPVCFVDVDFYRIGFHPHRSKPLVRLAFRFNSAALSGRADKGRGEPEQRKPFDEVHHVL